MDVQLQRLARRSAGESPGPPLKDLVGQLRPKLASDIAQATANLRALTYQLERHPHYRQGIRSALLELLEQTRQIQLYTDTGLLSNEPFSQAILRRIGHRLLPDVPSPHHLADQFSVLFCHPQDYRWVQGLPPQVWEELWLALHWDEESSAFPVSTRRQLLEALQVLSARITAIGLEPELIRVFPDIERWESPFLALPPETARFVEGARAPEESLSAQGVAADRLRTTLDRCESLLTRVRLASAERGVSISLTYHLVRLDQHIRRMLMLLRLLDPRLSPARDGTLFVLLGELVRADNRRNVIGDVFLENTALLARQVTEHAGRHGEHYIAEKRSEWRLMAFAAMGAGILVGFMALIKILLAGLHLPPIWEALAFGLNYGLGFVLVQILHFTIATKQPAMTAARIAAFVHEADGQPQLQQLADLVSKVSRTQFVAILGNVLLALPMSLLLGALWQLLSGAPVVGDEKAAKMLADLHPLTSYALFHAGIAGVYLFLSGLIAGYYDNMAIYQNIEGRLAGLRILRWPLGEERATRLARYLATNLGGFAGNMYFGMFLGVTGTIGYLLGLPLDIRHITFSTANLAYAGVTLTHQLHWEVVLWSVIGVVLIGGVNLLVSFALALWVALLSRRLSPTGVVKVVPGLVRYFFSRPTEFFVPPREELVVSENPTAVVPPLLPSPPSPTDLPSPDEER